MNKQPRKQVTSKQPIGTWFFQCIQECEFAENTWSPDEVIAVPAGTKVPTECFEEIGRLPYVGACLVVPSGPPEISVGKDDKGEFRHISITDLPDYALRAAKAQPGYDGAGDPVELSFSPDRRRVKLAFLEANDFYRIAVVEAIEASGNTNMALLPPPELEDALDLSGWDMVRRRKFEWALLEEHALWEKSGQPGQFEQWLETRRPALFRCTGSPFEMFVESARVVTSTPSFRKWAGGKLVTLAIVFTDIPDSTALGKELRDERMGEVRQAHFAQSRKLSDQFEGREIKTIGDSVMVLFHSVDQALDYAMALHANPGHARVQIRAGIHIGPMQVEENDVFGTEVDFAARVKEAIQGAEIWLSDRAKEYLDKGGAAQFDSLVWERHDGVPMKGFADAATLWSLRK